MKTLTKLIVIQAIILIIQIIMYFGSEIFQHNFHNPHRPIDDRIPRIPAFVFPYSLWFPLIAVFPIVLYFYSPENWVALQISWLVCLVVSVAAYLVYPTTFEREPLGQANTERLLSFVYKASYRGVNCAPSLHCSTSMMIGFIAIVTPGMPWWLRLLFVVVALAIILATQFTKQHVLLDLVTAIPVAVLSLSIGFGLTFAGNGVPLLAGLGL